MQTFSPDNTGHAKMAATCKRAKRFLWLGRKWPLRKTMHDGPGRSHRNVSYALHLKMLKILPKCQFYTKGTSFPQPIGSTSISGLHESVNHRGKSFDRVKGPLQCKEASQALEENFLRSVSIAQNGVSAESWAEVGRHCTSLGSFTMIFLIKFGQARKPVE